MNSIIEMPNLQLPENICISLQNITIDRKFEEIEHVITLCSQISKWYEEEIVPLISSFTNYTAHAINISHRVDTEENKLNSQSFRQSIIEEEAEKLQRQAQQLIESLDEVNTYLSKKNIQTTAEKLIESLSFLQEQTGITRKLWATAYSPKAIQEDIFLILTSSDKLFQSLLKTAALIQEFDNAVEDIHAMQQHS